MRRLVLLVRSMGVRGGLRAWCRLTELQAEARLRQRAGLSLPRPHHGERPNMPGWRR